MKVLDSQTYTEWFGGFASSCSRSGDFQSQIWRSVDTQQTLGTPCWVAVAGTPEESRPWVAGWHSKSPVGSGVN